MQFKHRISQQEIVETCEPTALDRAPDFCKLQGYKQRSILRVHPGQACDVKAGGVQSACYYKNTRRGKRLWLWY